MENFLGHVCLIGAKGLFGLTIMNVAKIIALVLSITIVLLSGWRWLDHRADRVTWTDLVNRTSPTSKFFDPAMVQNLPEPAQRYFGYTIRPGTPLRYAVEIDMQGELGLGSKDEPNYKPMSAKQILAPPLGLV